MDLLISFSSRKTPANPQGQWLDEQVMRTAWYSTAKKDSLFGLPTIFGAETKKNTNGGPE